MNKFYQSVNKSIDIESSAKHINLIKINFKANSKTADHINASHKPSRNKQLNSNVNTPTTNKIPEIAMN